MEFDSVSGCGVHGRGFEVRSWGIDCIWEFRPSGCPTRTANPDLRDSEPDICNAQNESNNIISYYR